MQLNHGEELLPMHGMHGTLDVELEVQRTINRAEMTAFLCLLKKDIGTTKVHVDNNGRDNPLAWIRVRRCKKYRIKKVERRLLGKNFSFFEEYNLQRLQSKQEDSTEDEEMKQQQRMAIMKDLIKEIRSKGSMDTKSRWWVAKLLAKDCEKAWAHTGWEDTMQKWYECLEYMKKDEKEKWRRCISERWRK